jgi:hypothetical protein
MRLMLGAILAALLTGGFPPATTADEAPAVVVFDIELCDVSLDAKTLKNLTEYLSVLVAEGDYRVVPRERVAKAGACDHGCRVKVAHEVSAQKFLVTRIFKISESCRVTGALYNLDGKTIVKAAAAGGKCGQADILAAVEEVGGKLAGTRPGSAGDETTVDFPPATWGMGTGRLSLNADPWGRIWIDGKDTGHITPLIDYQLPAGWHQIVVRSPRGVAMATEVEIWPEESTSLILKPSRSEAARNTGLLVLNTYPWGEVIVDGIYVGTTPIRRMLPAGPHKVKVTFAHGESKTQEVVIEPRKTSRLILHARSSETYSFKEGMGQLKLHTSPWSRVWVDGKDMGMATPVFTSQLPAGKHKITIYFSSGGYMTEEVVIKAGETLRKIIREEY